MSPGARFLLMAACFVVVAAGMRAAAPIIVPFLLALFIALISAPPLFWLQEKGVPRGAALLVIVVAIIGFCFALAGLISRSLTDFTEALPAYKAGMDDELAALSAWLESKGLTPSQEFFRKTLDTKVVVKLTSNVLLALSAVITNLFFIVLLAIFILLEAASFPRKARRMMNTPDASMEQVNRLVADVKRYIFLKTLVSLGTGVFVAAWLAVAGVDYYVLWGVIAFLLNYVPNIGSIIAAIPAVLLALVQSGFQLALVAALGYVVVNIAVGNVIEPRVMGRGLGLSSLVVLLSLVFWGWVLGPVGMLLSIPLTMMVKIGLEGNEQTRWVSILLGPEEAGDR